MGVLFQWVLIIAIAWFILRRFLPVKGVENITVQKAKAMVKDRQIQFVDVRSPGEYKTHHEKPFQNMPLSHLAQQAKSLDQTKEVVVICQSGMRSMQACRMLKKAGFEKVNNVKGGLSAWS